MKQAPKTYTIDQIKNYILSQDSLGDVIYNLNEEKMDEAQEEQTIKQDDADEYEEDEREYEESMNVDDSVFPRRTKEEVFVGHSCDCCKPHD